MTRKRTVEITTGNVLDVLGDAVDATPVEQPKEQAQSMPYTAVGLHYDKEARQYKLAVLVYNDNKASVVNLRNVGTTKTEAEERLKIFIAENFLTG